MVDLVRVSELTCPECGFEKAEVMPTDSCQWFYECRNCAMLSLNPNRAIVVFIVLLARCRAPQYS